MLDVKLTSFNGNTKVIAFNNANAVRSYLENLPNVLPKTMSLQVSCDALCISGVIKGKN
jgi:hypothetical protein